MQKQVLKVVNAAVVSVVVVAAVVGAIVGNVAHVKALKASHNS